MTDLKKILTRANEILHAGDADEVTSDDTKALIFIGVHIIGAIDRLTAAVDRNTKRVRSGDTVMIDGVEVPVVVSSE